MRFAPLLAVALLALLVPGCHHGLDAEQIVGKWQCTDIKLPATADQKIKDAIQSVIPKTSAEFKKDKTFVFSFAYPVEGTWTLTGSTIAMTATKVSGMPIAKIKEMAISRAKSDLKEQKKIRDSDPNMTATVTEDGKTISLHQNAGSGTSIILTKQP